MSFDQHSHETQRSRDANLGRRLGSYELVQRIGEGGMGVVYRAHHIDSGEEFAIKLIKRGMDTQSVLRRFHTERRILEGLRHSNIASLLDVGATREGLPYFVMEYIAGEPITRYCDSNHLSIPLRLRLFEKVCSAVQCAHESRIVHRDIKPENILVTAAGEPKLLDFGIAKVLDVAGPTQDAAITTVPVMTPHYASPEQVRGLPVNSSSDIYSLGVLLCELLAGRSPYRVKGTSAVALVRAISHEPPQAPSSAVAQMDPADPKSIALAANRDTGRTALRQDLSGDLDAIVLKALQKKPARRYRTAAEFSDDIRRHLAGERVRARSLSRRYLELLSGARARVAVVVLLIVCAALLTVLYRNTRQRGLNVRHSVAVLGFQNLSNEPSADWLGTALTEALSTELAAGGRIRVVPGELVSRVKLELVAGNSQILAQPALQRLGEILSADYVVVGSYRALGEGAGQKISLDTRLHGVRQGELVASASDTRPTLEIVDLVANAGAALRRHIGAAAATSSESGSLRSSLPNGAEAARNYSEGLEKLRSFDALGARELLRKAINGAPRHALSHAALAYASSLLGYDAEARNEAKRALDLSAGLSREERLSIEARYLETTQAWSKAVAIYQTLRNEYPDNLEYGLRLAEAQTQTGEPSRALQTVRSMRALPSAAHDPRVDLAEAESSLASSDLKSARDAAARAAQSGTRLGMRIPAARAHLIACRIAVASGDPQTSLAEAAESQQLYLAAGYQQGVAWALNETAGVLTQRGDIAGARARYEQALAICEVIGDQGCIATDLDSLGVLRRRQGDLRGALEMHKKALERRRSVGDRPGVATSLYNSGNVLETLGDLEHAREATAEALEIRRQLGEPRSTALTMSRLGNIRRREGELREALRMNEEAVGTLRAIGDRGGQAMAQVNLGLALFDSGDLSRSRSTFEEALAIRRQQSDRNNIAQTAAGLAVVAQAQDRLSEASALITESISLRQKLGETFAVAQSTLIQSAILLEQKDIQSAERSARKAAAIFHQAAARVPEAEAAIAIARAQLARGNAAGARGTLASTDKLLADTKDVRLRLWRDITLARILYALDRKNESAAVLDRTLSEARQRGLPEIVFEIRLATSEPDRSSAAQIASDAQRAGFLLIARKAGL